MKINLIFNNLNIKQHLLIMDAPVAIKRDKTVKFGKDKIFKEVNVISFHVPLNIDTAYMADYQFFRSFNRPVWVLNISRGKVLKTKDLIQALNDELVLGAALDVLDEESKSFDIQEVNDKHRYWERERESIKENRELFCGAY